MGVSTSSADLDTVARVADRIRSNVERVIEGKSDVVHSTLVVLLAEGHLLIEDVPGVGKTQLAKRWPARSTARCGASSSRRTCCPRT